MYDSIFSITQDHIRNWLNGLKKKIDQYASVGIKYMLLATNLEDNYVWDFKRELDSYINEKDYTISLEGVIGANLEMPIGKFNDIANKISVVLQQNKAKEINSKWKLNKDS